MKYKHTFILIIIFLLLTSCGENRSPADNTIQVGYIPAFSGLPTFVILNDDLLSTLGYSASSIEFSNSDLVVQALKDGKIDLIGVAGTSQLLEASLEEDFSKILGVFYSSTCIIKNSDLDEDISLETLSGKRIGVFPGTVFGRYAREVLVKSEVPVESVTFTPISPGTQVSAIRDGRVDVLYTLEPVCAEAVQRGVANYITKEDLFSNLFLNGSPFPGGVVAVSKDFYERQPVAVDSLISVYKRTTKEIESGSNFSQYLNRFTKIDQEITGNLSYLGAEYGDEIDTESLKTLSNLLFEWGLIESEVDIDKLVHTE